MNRVPQVSWIAAIVLALAAPAQTRTPAQSPAQPKNGVAFWEVDPEPVDALLHAAPKGDALRYDALHKGFQKFQCTAGRMEEEPAGKNGEKNLICTLPGETADRILVIARYDEHLGRAWPTWGNALALMLLYHALQAQLREHTFVIAEIATEDGEKAFFRSDRLHKPPALTIVVDSFGLSEPHLTVAPPKRGPDFTKLVETQELLEVLEDKTKLLMGIPAWQRVQSETDDDAINREAWIHEILQSSLFRAVQRTPAAVLYSETGSALNPEAFHQDFDFLAWLMCGIDLKLAAPAETAAH